MKFLLCRRKAIAIGILSVASSLSIAGERPTFNNTRDPRPDILPYSLHNTLPEYRRTYNRPRFWSGWLAQQIAPSSQEAMVWCENYRAGAYNVKNAPPRYKRYYAPKPWEVLQTGARPDFAKPTSVPSSNYGNPIKEADEPNIDQAEPSAANAEISEETVPTPTETSSPSDR
ncbi:MAG: hypothetical protein ACE361_24380 [Aureliella sp.]